MKRLFVLLAVLLVALPIISACGAEPTPGFTPRPGPEVGRSAPELGWKTADGESDKLSDHRGQVVIVVFWSPGCSYCLEELPILQGLHDKYHEDLSVVSFTTDTSGAWNAVKEKFDLTFPIVIDPKGQSFAMYWVNALPTIFVIDREGVIRVRQEGALGKGELEGLLKPLLEER